MNRGQTPRERILNLGRKIYGVAWVIAAVLLFFFWERLGGMGSVLAAIGLLAIHPNWFNRRWRSLGSEDGEAERGSD